MPSSRDLSRSDLYTHAHNTSGPAYITAVPHTAGGGHDATAVLFLISLPHPATVDSEREKFCTPPQSTLFEIRLCFGVHGLSFKMLAKSGYFAQIADVLYGTRAKKLYGSLPAAQHLLPPPPRASMLIDWVGLDWMIRFPTNSLWRPPPRAITRPSI